MIREERLNLILNYVNSNKYCSNEDISKALNIPFTTLRRDLNDLNHNMQLIRVHGGAKSIQEKSVLEFTLQEKLNVNIEAKKLIAKKALACVKPLETVFLDAGSSTYYLAQLFEQKLNVRVYTNSLINAQVLAANNIQDIYLLPGKLKLSTGAICGVETIAAITNYNFDVSFIGLNAVDSEYNFYTTDDDEAEIKKLIIKNSQHTFGLVDSSKLNTKSFVKFSDKKQIALITERG